jgi:hypothetical protein
LRMVHGWHTRSEGSISGRECPVLNGSANREN